MRLDNPGISDLTDYITIVYSISEPTINPWLPQGDTSAAAELYINNSPTSTQLIDSLTKIATQLLELTRAFSDLSKEVMQLQKDVDLLKDKQGG